MYYLKLSKIAVDRVLLFIFWINFPVYLLRFNFSFSFSFFLSHGQSNSSVLYETKSLIVIYANQITVNLKTLYTFRRYFMIFCITSNCQSLWVSNFKGVHSRKIISVYSVFLFIYIFIYILLIFISC